MNLQPILEDELIILRPLQQSDFGELYEVASDPLIWEQHPSWDRYKIEEFERYFDDSIKSNGAFVIIERECDKIIGSTRFKKVKNRNDVIEIGWSFLRRDKWGGKYNRSMKRLMLDHAFQSLNEVVFYIGPNNIRSQRAVQKIGGKRVANPSMASDALSENGNWTYSIMMKDWLGAK